jgi:hypothetical protein
LTVLPPRLLLELLLAGRVYLKDGLAAAVQLEQPRPIPV